MCFRLNNNYHDAASRFLKILTKGQERNYLLPEDFMPLVQDVVDTHPGLTFLKEAIEFHSRYVHTVCTTYYIFVFTIYQDLQNYSLNISQKLNL